MSSSSHRSGSGKRKKSMRPFTNMPAPFMKSQNQAPPPDDERCFALWRKYDMLPNIRRHSLLVAHIAECLAKKAASMGMDASPPTARAAGLLHDIAKTYCLRHGGSHAMLGAAWTVAETRHYGIAQSVILHVEWPWKLPEGPEICSLPFFIIYADKRVRHDQCVTLRERFDDLILRYGRTKKIRTDIENTFAQAKNLEKYLSHNLGWNLDEDYFDSRRLVQREGSIPGWSEEH